MTDTSPKNQNQTRAFSWIIYDLGHTGFTMIVLAVLFPILFQEFWTAGNHLEHYQKTAYYSYTLGIASLLVAVLSPILSTLAQMGGFRMRLFRIFCLVGIVGMGTLCLVGEGQWHEASIIYILAALGFFCANLFYDSLLIDVSTEKNRALISGAAFSIGYIGGILLLGFIALWTQHWEKLGFESAPDPRLCFLIGALWWLLFALPLLFRKKTATIQSTLSLKNGLLALKETCADFWKTKEVRWFILAYFFYIDGVHTIITSAIRYGKALGFEQQDLFIALLIVQCFGVPFALLFGLLGKYLGAKNIIFAAVGIYIGVSFYGAFMPVEPISILGYSISPMFILAALIGMVQGGVQALSRSYFSSIVPPGREISFFGFYSMIGRCSTILGPILLGLAAQIFYREDAPLFSTRAGIACISILFIVGILFLSFSQKKQIPS